MTINKAGLYIDLVDFNEYSFYKAWHRSEIYMKCFRTETATILNKRLTNEPVTIQELKDVIIETNYVLQEGLCDEFSVLNQYTWECAGLMVYARPKLKQTTDMSEFHSLYELCPLTVQTLILSLNVDLFFFSNDFVTIHECKIINDRDRFPILGMTTTLAFVPPLFPFYQSEKVCCLLREIISRHQLRAIQIDRERLKKYAIIPQNEFRFFSPVPQDSAWFKVSVPGQYATSMILTRQEQERIKKVSMGNIFNLNKTFLLSILQEFNEYHSWNTIH